MIQRFKVTEEMKRQILLKKLIERKVFTTKDGVSIYDLDYPSLRREVALLEFREIDVESSAEAWF